MSNKVVGHFGVTSLVFFRRHADTNEPLFGEPQVWTFNVADVSKARRAERELRRKDHLYVPANALTISTHDPVVRTCIGE